MTEEQKEWRKNLESVVGAMVTDFMIDTDCDKYVCSECGFEKICREVWQIVIQMPGDEEEDTSRKEKL